MGGAGGRTGMGPTTRAQPRGRPGGTCRGRRREAEAKRPVVSCLPRGPRRAPTGPGSEATRPSGARRGSSSESHRPHTPGRSHSLWCLGPGPGRPAARARANFTNPPRNKRSGETETRTSTKNAETTETWIRVHWARVNPGPDSARQSVRRTSSRPTRENNFNLGSGPSRAGGDEEAGRSARRSTPGARCWWRNPLGSCRFSPGKRGDRLPGPRPARSPAKWLLGRSFRLADPRPGAYVHSAIVAGRVTGAWPGRRSQATDFQDVSVAWVGVGRTGGRKEARPFRVPGRSGCFIERSRERNFKSLFLNSLLSLSLSLRSRGRQDGHDPTSGRTPKCSLPFPDKKGLTGKGPKKRVSSLSSLNDGKMVGTHPGSWV